MLNGKVDRTRHAAAHLRALNNLLIDQGVILHKLASKGLTNHTAYVSGRPLTGLDHNVSHITGSEVGYARKLSKSGRKDGESHREARIRARSRFA